MQTIRHYINGINTKGGCERVTKRCPVTGEISAQFGLADAEVVNCAVQAASAALAGPWANLKAEARAEMLDLLAERVDSAQAELIVAEVTRRPAKQPNLAAIAPWSWPVQSSTHSSWIRR